MDEAAAILAVALINSHQMLQTQLAAQATQNPQAGADFIVSYFVSIRKTLEKRKQERAW